MDIVRRKMMLITIRVKLFTSLSLEKDCKIKKLGYFKLYHGVSNTDAKVANDKMTIISK